MRFIFALAVLPIFFCGCTGHSSTEASDRQLPPRLQERFEGYCGYTGNMGIGFDASQTYDYRFRQQLIKTHDPELKRLFVLQFLFRDTENALNEWEAGVVRTGKNEYRPFTPAERQEQRKNIQTELDDLAAYVAFKTSHRSPKSIFAPADPKRDEMWIEDLRRRFSNPTTKPYSDISLGNPYTIDRIPSLTDK